MTPTSPFLQHADLQRSLFGVTAIMGMERVETWWREALRVAVWTMTVNAGGMPTVGLSHVRTMFDRILPAPLRQPLTDLVVTDGPIQATTTTSYNYLQHLRHLLADLVATGDAIDTGGGICPAPVRLVQVPSGGVLVTGGIPTALLPIEWMRELRSVGHVRLCAPLVFLTRLNFDYAVVSFAQWLSPMPPFRNPFRVQRAELLAYFQALPLVASPYAREVTAFQAFVPVETATALHECWQPLAGLADGRYLLRDTTGYAVGILEQHALIAHLSLGEAFVMPLVYALLPQAAVVSELQATLYADRVVYVVHHSVPEPLAKYFLAVGTSYQTEWPRPYPFTCTLLPEQHAEVVAYCGRLGITFAMNVVEQLPLVE